ncbi:MAG: hypothetical protein K2I26_09525 [Paramuribaculum sp.]|nr:hypothetical protein [Paramuribaculum sp.]
MTYQEFLSKYSYDRKTDKVYSGRFGAIYKAKEGKRGKEVFVRLMRVDDESAAATLASEVDFVNSLPANPSVVRYSRSYRFEEATGEVDCAIMDFYPLGNLPRLLEDWKLDNEERKGLRDRIVAAVGFLRENGVKMGAFDPSAIFVSEENGALIPHLVDLSGTDADNPAYLDDLALYLPVEEPAEEAVEESVAETVADPAETSGEEPLAEPSEEPAPAAVEEESPEELLEESPEEADEAVVPDAVPEPEGRTHKGLLLGGVALTWVAISALIWFVHVNRNPKGVEAEAAADTTVIAPVYPADEFARQEAARLDSIEKARQDSVAAFKADSIAYMKRIEAERARKAKEAERRKAEAAAAEEAPKPKADEEPVNTHEHVAPQPQPQPHTEPASAE